MSEEEKLFDGREDEDWVIVKVMIGGCDGCGGGDGSEVDLVESWIYTSPARLVETHLALG
jgi:hypothetical protein